MSNQNPNFNPKSNDAVFATILARLESQDKSLAKILEQTTLTNGRVTKLEAYKFKATGYVAGCVGVIVVVFEVLRFLYGK